MADRQLYERFSSFTKLQLIAYVLRFVHKKLLQLIRDWLVLDEVSLPLVQADSLVAGRELVVSVYMSCYNVL